MKLAISATILILILFISGCAPENKEKTISYKKEIIKESAKNISKPASEGPLTEIQEIKYTNNQSKPYKTSHYQLQGTEFTALKDLDVDYLIIDIDDSELTKPQIEELKKDKIVLSYLSIGEAEDYREYWQDSWEVGSPDFLDKENPDWQGNYRVKFWYKEWQDIIQESMQRIIDKGYDGAYLDTVDTYDYYEENGKEDAINKMDAFVATLSEYAKAQNPKFMIISQNALELYDLARFRSSIDGFGKESTWYIDNNIKDSDETDYELEYLDRAISDRKIVLAIDYPSDNGKVCDFYQRCRAQKFICTVSGRELEMELLI